MSNHIQVEVRWTNPDKDEDWVLGELRVIRNSVVWVPLDPDKAEWTWSCKWENLGFESTRLVSSENQLSEDHKADGQLELFPLWGTDK